MAIPLKHSPPMKKWHGSKVVRDVEVVADEAHLETLDSES